MQYPIDTISTIELKLIIQRLNNLIKTMEKESLTEVSTYFFYLEIKEELEAFKNLLHS